MESRSTHPSAAQAEILIQFLEANPDLAKGYSRNAGAKSRSNLKWEALKNKLNSVGGTIKTKQKWIKYWTDKKNAVKKKAAARNAARRRTGGGLVDVPELTEMEERILSVMGGERFASGDTHLQYDLFGPSTSNDDSSPNVLLERPQSSPEQILAYDTDDVDMTLGHRNQSEVSLDSYVDPAAGVRSVVPSLSPAIVPPTTVPAPLAEIPVARSRSLTLPSECSLTTATTVSAPHPRPATPPPTRPEAREPRRMPRSRRRGLIRSPPSQRRSQFESLTEKFLRLEEQRLELDRRLVVALEQSGERERLTAQANLVLGEGLKALAEAINNYSRH